MGKSSFFSTSFFSTERSDSCEECSNFIYDKKLKLTFSVEAIQLCLIKPQPNYLQRPIRTN